MKRLRTNVLILFFFFFIISVFGKAKVTLFVKDSFSKEMMDSVMVRLFDLKGNMLDSMFHASPYFEFQGRDFPMGHLFNITDTGKYEIRIYAPRHEVKTLPIEIRHSSQELALGDIYVDKVVELDEVAITTSKVKMVMKGDTIVYNADAFKLANGSMLDRLIEQLPGVELNDKGQITVNGEFVSSLLINGKDFFSGNPSVALQNLPAYTVNKVKVYRKEDRDAYLRDRSEVERKSDPLVMDVNLKKHFLGSYIVNADVAGGSSGRYSMRAFLAGFDNDNNFGIYGNLNNIGAVMNPSRYSVFDAGIQDRGNKIFRSAGIEYTRDPKNSNYYLTVQAKGESNTTNLHSLTNTLKYLPDNYNYSSRNTELSRQTAGRLDLFASLGVSLKKFFTRTSISGLFLRNKGKIQGQTLSNSGDVFLDSLKLDDPRLINRYFNASNHLNTTSDFSLNEDLTIRMPYNKDVLKLEFRGRHAETRNTEWSVSNNIYSTSRSILNDFMRSPSHRTTFNARATYEHKFIFGLNLTTGYEYFHSRVKNERTLSHFLPDSVMSQLPVITDTLTMISDLKQSFLAETHSDNHTVKVNAGFRIQNVSFQIELPYSFIREAMTDSRAPSLVRNTPAFNPKMDIFWKFLQLKYTMKTDLPSAQQLLDFTDDSELLTVRKGNPDLKNALTHTATATFTRTFPQKLMNYNIKIGFSETSDMIANALSFNPQTGVSTIMAYNLDGNRVAWLQGAFGKNFGYKHRFRFDASMNTNFYRSVAFASTGTPEFVRSIVHSTYIMPSANLSYTADNFNVTGSFYGKKLKTSGNLESFVSTNAFNGGIGLSGWVTLPFGFQFETNLGYSIETGYAIPEMNRNRLLWIAGLQKAFGHSNEWILRVDGFDILGQISDVSRTVNVQGITETITNQLGRYIMLHLQYKWNYVKAKTK